MKSEAKRKDGSMDKDSSRIISGGWGGATTTELQRNKVQALQQIHLSMLVEYEQARHAKTPVRKITYLEQ